MDGMTTSHWMDFNGMVLGSFRMTRMQ
jgi:hypothetical protein